MPSYTHITTKFQQNTHPIPRPPQKKIPPFQDQCQLQPPFQNHWHIRYPHSRTFIRGPPTSTAMMASSSNASCWEAPKFLFYVPNQAEEWKIFYTWVVNFFKALDIHPDTEDQSQIQLATDKIMLEGKECQDFKTLLNNNTITPEDPVHPNSCP